MNASALPLRTERLLLRRFTPEDRDSLFAIVSDPQTCDDDGGYPPYTAQDARFEQLLASFLGDETRYAIALPATNKAIGLIHLFQAAPGAIHEIGYVLDKDHRKQGYATEAIAAFLSWSATTMGITQVSAGTFPWNEASMRLLERLGFQRTGTTPNAQHHSRRGPVDIVHHHKTLIP